MESVLISASFLPKKSKTAKRNVPPPQAGSQILRFNIAFSFSFLLSRASLILSSTKGCNVVLIKISINALGV